MFCIYLIQPGLITGEGEGEGQRVFLLCADVLLLHEVLQRLSDMVKELQTHRVTESKEGKTHAGLDF